MRRMAVFVRFTRAKKPISKNEQPFCVDLINLLIKFHLCIFRMPSKQEDRFKTKNCLILCQMILFFLRHGKIALPSPANTMIDLCYVAYEGAR